MDSLEREALERKKKMIALGCLPLSVGFFVWRLQSNTSAAPPPKAPPPPVTAKAAPTVAAAAGPVLTLEKGRIVAVPAGSRDPFRPAFAVQPAKEAKGPEKAPAHVEPVQMPPLRLATLPPLPTPGLQPFAPPDQPTLPEFRPVPVKPAAPVVPYMLTGIVKGEPDVAILRHADGSRRIARVGDMLDRKFRLASITETSIVIEGAGIQKTLELGQAGFRAAQETGGALDGAASPRGTQDPKTETTLGEGNDTNNS